MLARGVASFSQVSGRFALNVSPSMRAASLKISTSFGLDPETTKAQGLISSFSRNNKSSSSSFSFSSSVLGLGPKRFYSTSPPTETAAPVVQASTAPVVMPKPEDLSDARLELSILNEPLKPITTSETESLDISYVNKQIAPAPEWITDPDFPSSWYHYPISWADEYMRFLHDLGIPWWGTICLAAVTIRVALLPVSLFGVINSSKMQRLSPETAEVTKRVQREFPNLTGWERMRKNKEEIAKIWKREGVSPFKSLYVALFQVPVFISMILSVRRLCFHESSLKTENFLWVSDLSTADPQYRLAFISTLLFMVNIEIPSSKYLGAGTVPMSQKVMKWVFRGSGVFMFFVICDMAQAVHLYWIATSLLQVGQFFFFRIPFMRRTFNLPANVGSVTHNIPPPPVTEVAKVVARPIKK
eukprot:TRINITY_DN413_c0_g1_i1.p1 TRINITY_DN413_c0_g1~~TRINITY_DN413_c0_g1_i1.p1  ORF type:complete len:423 (-),score=165.75 TRINITY_DN413_c0_g1_i1:20-1264(-)